MLIISTITVIGRTADSDSRVFSFSFWFNRHYLLRLIVGMAATLGARRDGAATARKQSAKAFSNSGCYAEVHGAHSNFCMTP